MKNWKLAAVLLVLIVAAVEVVVIVWLFQANGSELHSERNVIEVLKREQLNFLVTDRITTLVMVQSDDSNPLLGKKEGILIAKAKLYYGIDLDKLTEANVSRTNERLVVQLPEPEELDFSVDLESMQFISKRSGLMVITDWIRSEDQEDVLRTQFKDVALKNMNDDELIPTKGKILERLTNLSEMITEYFGSEVVFK